MTHRVLSALIVVSLSGLVRSRDQGLLLDEISATAHHDPQEEVSPGKGYERIVSVNNDQGGTEDWIEECYDILRQRESQETDQRDNFYSPNDGLSFEKRSEEENDSEEDSESDDYTIWSMWDWRTQSLTTKDAPATSPLLSLRQGTTQLIMQQPTTQGPTPNSRPSLQSSVPIPTITSTPVVKTQRPTAGNTATPTITSKIVPAKAKASTTARSMATAAKSVPSKSTVTTTVPSIATSTTSVPSIATATTSVPSKSTATTSVPSKSTATTSVPSKATSTTSVPSKVTATTNVPSKATAATSVPSKATAATSVPSKATAATSVPSKATAATSVTSKATSTTSVPSIATATTSVPSIATATASMPDILTTSAKNKAVSSTPAASRHRQLQVQNQQHGLHAGKMGLAQGSTQQTQVPTTQRSKSSVMPSWTSSTTSRPSVKAAPTLQHLLTPPFILPQASTTPQKPTTAQPISPPPSCYVCGDASTPCSPLDLLLGTPQPCPSGTSYCMVDVLQTAGVREIRKRCVDEVTCYKDWFKESSDESSCISFDPRDTSKRIDCHFCCTTDNCNRPLKPDRSSWYMP